MKDWSSKEAVNPLQTSNERKNWKERPKKEIISKKTMKPSSKIEKGKLKI